ncbi:MAG: alpha/beta hydrolase [Rhodobiaceae bacterium]|nr:alpha/beta hydrolase [Rhodobiaceae bacterium]MCC0055941.1 alpha/beta hydrolase [Rhodobiaceae bacterium]
MATFVLVHGGWHGGWCYRRVADLLRAQGHVVFTPTLTGLADRSHHFDETIDLTTHQRDITNLIRWEGLRDVVLAGHSYGGMVITRVANDVAQQLSALVFIDAMVPEAGECLADLMSPALRDRIKALAAEGETSLPPIAAAHFNVNADDAQWVDSLCTGQPVRTFTEPAGDTSGRDTFANKIYVRAADYPSPGLDAMAERAKAQGGWRYEEIAGGHDLMVDNPQGLADILLGA